MPYKPGYEEDGFLKSLSPLNLTEIELMASNCTQVKSQNAFFFQLPLTRFKLPPKRSDPRVAHTIKEESKRDGSRHEQIQQHKLDTSKADTRVTSPEHKVTEWKRKVLKTFLKISKKNEVLIFKTFKT